MGHSKKQDEKYDAKMAYNKNLSAKARMHYLENNIADHKGPSAYGKMHKGPDMYGKKHDGPSAYGKMHKGPSKMDPMYNGKPGVQKEDFQQFAGPSKHGEMHDSPMSMGGSFMSKHSSNSYFHKQNLLDDMPIDDHAGGPLNQTEQKQSMLVKSSPEEIAILQKEAKKNKLLNAAIQGAAIQGGKFGKDSLPNVSPDLPFVLGAVHATKRLNKKK